MDFAALLDRAADRLSACMDTKVERIDSKLGLLIQQQQEMRSLFIV